MIGRALVLGQLLGIVLVASAFRRFSDLGDTVPAMALWVAMAVGLLLFAACARSIDDGLPPAKAGAWPIALGAALALSIPSPTVVCLCVGAGAVFVGSVSRTDWLVRTGLQALLCLLAVTAAIHLIDLFALQRPELPWVARWVAGIGELLGWESAAGVDRVLIEGPRSELAFRASPTTLGLSVHVAVVVTWGALRWAGGVSAPGWLSLALYLPLVLITRLALVVAAGLVGEHVADYDVPDFDLSPMLDWRYGLVIDAAAATGVGWLLFRTTESTPVARSASSLVLLAALCVGVSWSTDRILDASPDPKAGRIAIDERHSRWESSDLPLGRAYYGQESGYNFRGLADWLESRFGQIRRIYDPLTEDVLGQVDVLIIKTPTEHYTTDELATLDAFVQRGGGLVLIGDHTNVYGTSEVLNSIAHRYGVDFQYDCCFDHRNRFEYCYWTEPQVRGHPVVRGVESLLFEVGCTLDLNSLRARPLIVGRALKSQEIDYNVENFYPSPRDSSDQACGQFALVVACVRGTGRVVMIADSTLFSTFSVFMPGRRELVEGAVEYVNHRDVGEGVRSPLYRLSWVITLLLGLLVRRRGLVTLVAVGAMAWGASQASCAAADRWLYPGPDQPPHEQVARNVTFVWEDGWVDWGAHGFRTDFQRAYALFFQFVVRSGGFPRLLRDRQAALDSGGPVLWFNPGPVAPIVAEQTADFVRGGGTLFLLESAPNAAVTAIAREAGIEISADRKRTGPLDSVYGVVPIPAGTAGFRSVTGGEPILVGEGDGSPVRVLTRHVVGDGQLVLVTCGELFADANYGGRYGVLPEPGLRRLYEVQFAMLAAAIDGAK